MVFVGCLTQLTLFLEKNIFCFSQETMSAVLDIPQNQLSWVRLTQTVSDQHIFLLSKHGRRQHAEGAGGGKVIADATNQ